MKKEIAKHLKVGAVFLTAVLSLFLILGNIAQVNAEVTLPSSVKSSLVAYWNLDSSQLIDSANNIKGIIYSYFPQNNNLVKGVVGNASYFNGNSCVQFTDNNDYSIGPNGITVSAWVKPESFDFTGEAEGYIHFLGKQEWNTAPNYEWTFRLYNDKAFDSVSRSKRISFYVFNLSGGLGVGSYFQDDLKENEWIHVVGVANGTHTMIYKNGVLRDTDAYAPGLKGFVDIVPGNGNSPLRIGCSDRSSAFQGSIDDVMIFDRALSSSEIKQLYESYSTTETPSNSPTPSTNTSNSSTNTSNPNTASVKPIDFYPNGQFIKAFRISNDSSSIVVQGLGTDTVQINDILRLTPMTTKPTCNSGKAGSIYFDANTKKHYGCNGSTWNALY